MNSQNLEKNKDIRTVRMYAMNRLILLFQVVCFLGYIVAFLVWIAFHVNAMDISSPAIFFLFVGDIIVFYLASFFLYSETFDEDNEADS